MIPSEGRKDKEPEEEEMTLAQKRERSEKVSQKVLRGVRKGSQPSSSKKLRQGEVKKGTMTKFSELFDAYIKGISLWP
jgi:hypothetical protein